MMQALGTFCALCCLCLLHGVMSMENGDSAAAGVVVAGILTAVCAMAFRRRSVLRTTYYKESSTKSPITPSPKANCARLIVQACGRSAITACPWIRTHDRGPIAASLDRIASAPLSGQRTAPTAPSRGGCPWANSHTADRPHWAGCEAPRRRNRAAGPRIRRITYGWPYSPATVLPSYWRHQVSKSKKLLRHPRMFVVFLLFP